MKATYAKDETGILEISLSGDLSISNVEELRKILDLRISNSEAIRIILHDIEQIDLLCLQLLIVAERHSKRIGKTVEFTSNLDEENTDLLEKSGLNTVFE